MVKQNANSVSNFSILISIVSIATTLFINIQIAARYIRSDGKTKALFGIIELLQFGYQYYVVLLGIVALILAIVGLRKDIPGNKKIIALFLSLIAVSIVFVRLWRLFV